MGSDKPPRHVAVAIVFDSQAHKLLMVSSRAYPAMWIRELPATDRDFAHKVSILTSISPLKHYLLFGYQYLKVG